MGARPELDPTSPEGRALDHVLEVAQRTVPDAVEGTSYGARALKLDGKPLLGVSAGLAHLSLLPFSPAAIDALREELSGFGLSKGAVRFSPDHPVPDDLIERIVRLRLAEIRPVRG